MNILITFSEGTFNAQCALRHISDYFMEFHCFVYIFVQKAPQSGTFSSVMDNKPMFWKIIFHTFRTK